MTRAVTLLLLLFAGGLLVHPQAAIEWTGRAPLGDLDPATLGADEPVEDPSAGARSLAERNLVRIVVPRDMAVAELLGIYGLDLPHVRRALALQEGRKELDDEYLLRAGSVYRLYLSEPPA